MYAIRNNKTKEWLYGTDYNYSPNRQRTSLDQVAIFDSAYQAEFNYKQRQCGTEYEIVKVELKAVEVIERIGHEARWGEYVEQLKG